ncbi:MAG TPA: hypothetical protein VMJ12_12250, partial [Candidatus Acidoferrales bacterium]|nr:hypothetical protein [Candidatus Acidoferrales bacterium]
IGLVVSTELLQLDGTPDSAKPDALQAEVNMLKHLQAETAAELHAFAPRRPRPGFQRRTLNYGNEK